MSSAASIPRSGIGTLTTAVRPSRATSTPIAPRPPVTARARSPSACSSACVSSSPRPVTTSSASFGAPGKARSIARWAAMAGRSAGSADSKLLAGFSSSAGSASVPSRHTAVTSETTGRRVTVCASRAQTPARGARRRPRNGMRPLSMRSPSSASVAGRTVSDPITAIRTTTIVASAIEVNTARPVNSSPASATITITPETTIARPTVAVVASSAACGPLPARRSSRSRRM